MPLELHVWGPAFSLPSFDPPCLAAITYLTQVLTNDEWVLVPSGDAVLSPTRELPALKDGATWVGGFGNIIEHLRSASNGGQWNLDKDIGSRGDITAFSSFIEAHGQPLLDLYLYVSSENYSATTRPAFLQLLHWPTEWILPRQRRQRAKARTIHLGMSHLDLDAAKEEEEKKAQAARKDSIIPEHLRVNRDTVTGWLKGPHVASRFRLDALADAFLEPLQQLLGVKDYMLSNDRMSSLDCIALGYLALALLPAVPHSWLADSMKARYPQLCQYVERLIQEIFGGQVKIEDALPNLRKSEQGHEVKSRSAGPKALPWRESEQGGFKQAFSASLSAGLEFAPLLNRLTGSTLVARHDLHTTLPDKDLVSGVHTPSSPLMDNLPIILATTTLLASLGGSLIYFSALPFMTTEQPSLSGRRTLQDLGEAGAMLNSMTFGSYETRSSGIESANQTIPIVEADVVVDG